MATASAAPNVRRIKMSELEKVKKLGSGGFGAVYEMIWKKPDGSKQVAAKMLPDPDFHEVNTLSSLDHPSIVKLLGYVDEGITFVLVLELCEGGSLRDHLDQHGGLSTNLDVFLDWAEQASIPIKYLRGKQIVHKDLKSPNYLITRGKMMKLADFGLAKNIKETISNATKRVSFAWMAPELFTEGKLSPNYDIFALAVVIWELWTGKTPFKGLEFQVIAWRVCHLKERPLIPADMPKPKADLLKQCWDEDWHKRPRIDHIISVITAVRTPIWQQQILAGPWVLKKRINMEMTYVRDIAMNPNGDIAVIIGLLSPSKVKVYSMEGMCKGSMDTTQGQSQGQWSDSWQIATSNDGSTYFVTNHTKYVHMYYSADCRPKDKGQRKSSCPQASSHIPSLKGLAVDANDNVYVGDVMSECINKHKQDGSYVTSIKVGIKPWYLAVTSQETIIIAQWEEPPQIVSNTGEVLHTLEHPTPTDWLRCNNVYCCRDTIFISNINELKQHEIFCYSVSGEYRYLGHLPIHGVNPRCLAMIGDDRVVVGEWGGHCSIYALQK